jgi:hypothetical protein
MNPNHPAPPIRSRELAPLTSPLPIPTPVDFSENAPGYGGDVVSAMPPRPPATAADLEVEDAHDSPPVRSSKLANRQQKSEKRT